MNFSDDQLAYPHGSVWRLIQMGERAALAANRCLPRKDVLALGEYQAGRLVLSRIVPPLFGDSPWVRAIGELADLLAIPDLPGRRAREVAEQLLKEVLASTEGFHRTNGQVLKAFIHCGLDSQSLGRREAAVRTACELFCRPWSPGAREYVRAWPGDRHIEIAHAFDRALRPPPMTRADAS